MRAKELLSEDSDKTVTINIPITITIPSGSGGGMPVVSGAFNDGELPPEPVWINPQQQTLELDKHKSGKRSSVLNQILDNSGAASDTDEQDEFNVAEDYESLSAEYNRLLEAKKLQ
jgi:hypothetical protein